MPTAGGHNTAGRNYSLTCLRLGLSLLGAALLLACGGGTQFRGGEYQDEQLHFRLGPLPSSSLRVESDEAKLAFRDEAHSSLFFVNGRCGLDGDDVPLKALISHLFLQFTEREILAERKLVIDGREALELELVAKLDGVSRRFVVTVLKKNGCVFDFVLLTPLPNSSDEGALREQYRAAVAGFQLLK